MFSFFKERRNDEGYRSKTKFRRKAISGGLCEER
jgi:hypothetical protein